MTDPTLEFYLNRNCPYAQRSWIALRALQVEAIYHDIELGKDNKTEAFLQLNPNGKVPVVQYGDTVVYESLVVNEYLQEVFGHPGVSLWPDDPGLRAWGRILIGQCDSQFIKAGYGYLAHKPQSGQTEEEFQEQERERQQALLEQLHRLDRALGRSPGDFFLGDSLSLVDIAYMPFFERLNIALETWKDLRIKELNVPSLNHWLDRMEQQESYQGTRSSPETIRELYARFLKLDYFQKVGLTQ